MVDLNIRMDLALCDIAFLRGLSAGKGRIESYRVKLPWITAAAIVLSNFGKSCKVLSSWLV